MSAVSSVTSSSLKKTVHQSLQEPEIPKILGCIGCGLCDCALRRTLAPGAFQVRSPKNTGALVEAFLQVSPGLEVEKSQGPGARLDQVMDGKLFGDASLIPREPEIPKTLGCIGCGFCDRTLRRTLAPGIFQVRSPKNSGALV